MTEDNIILGASPQDRWEAIRMCGDILVNHGYVTPSYVEDMMERERSFSVYLGNHVAIPHGLVTSREKILASGLSFVQTPQGVSFEEEKAYIFIGIAGKGEEHIDLLSRIAEVCMDPENVERLRGTKNREEVIQILKG